MEPLVFRALELLLARRARGASLSFGDSLDSTRDILLCAVGGTADLLSVLPAARALAERFRLARIHVLASPETVGVLEARSEIFEVIPWSAAPGSALSRGFWETVRDLRRRSFDMAVAFDEGDARLERILMGLCGARLRVGVHPQGFDAGLNLVITTAVAPGYRPVREPGFLSFLGIPSESLLPGLDLPVKDLQYARRLLDLRRTGRAKLLVGVDPGAGRCGFHPSPEKLAWLVETLAEKREAEPIVLTDGSGASWTEAFQDALSTPTLDIAPRGTRDVLACLAGCDLFLAGNTDLFHVAVALGIPSIGLFGAEDGARWTPPESGRCRIIRYRPGDRVVSADFLELADSVREGRMPPEPQERDTSRAAEDSPAGETIRLDPA
ncbi:MAG: hypothetical protein CME07_02885 [Gemmatimonadetes bacterium]|nr:hypothetical protein [Gemmatimonadota bacterium]